MYRKKILVVLVLAALLCSATALAAPEFTDIEGHWAETELRSWIAAGLAGGYPDGTFRPDEAVTRAEFAAFVNRAFATPRAAQGADFPDVPADAWFYQEVSNAVEAGLMSGYPDGTFRPQQNIIRQEAAAVLSRLLNLAPAPGQVFADADEIASWAQNAVAAVSAAGIMGGYPDGTFRPLAPITRAETLVTLDRGRAYEEVDLPLQVTDFQPGIVEVSGTAHTWTVSQSPTHPAAAIGEVTINFNQAIDKRSYESFDLRAYDAAGSRLAFLDEEAVRMLLHDRFRGGGTDQLKATIGLSYSEAYQAMNFSVIGEVHRLEVDIYNSARTRSFTVTLFITPPLLAEE